MKNINKIIIKTCEKAPFNLAFFEEKGICKKPNNYCQYCQKIKCLEDYYCYKKTYVFQKTLFKNLFI